MIRLESKINKNNLHHGYIIVGNRETNKTDLFSFLEDTLEMVTTGNPDFSYSDYNTVTIDDARALAETQGRMGFGTGDVSSRKVFVISTNIITDEAQNALLKVFEEPTLGTHFFILASQNTFLPTFLSRVQLIQTETVVGDGENVLDKSLSERLALVAKLAGDISDEKLVKQSAIELVNTIERELVEQGVEKNASALRECQSARTALFSRGAMIKMVLENLMIQI